MELTAETVSTFLQKVLQDFNVAHGAARCANESKDATVAKTEKILAEVIKSAGAEHLTITIDRTATSTTITTTIHH